MNEKQISYIFRKLPFEQQLDKETQPVILKKMPKINPLVHHPKQNKEIKKIRESQKNNSFKQSDCQYKTLNEIFIEKWHES